MEYHEDKKTKAMINKEKENVKSKEKNKLFYNKPNFNGKKKKQ